MNYQQRIDRAQQLLPAYSFLTGAPIEEVATFADQLIGVPAIALSEACGDSGLNAGSIAIATLHHQHSQ